MSRSSLMGGGAAGRRPLTSPAYSVWFSLPSFNKMENVSSVETMSLSLSNSPRLV